MALTRSESDSASRRAFSWWGYVGIGVFEAGVWLVAADVPIWNPVWYVPAWYGYLLVLDGMILHSQGHSFLRGRRRETVALPFLVRPALVVNGFACYGLLWHTQRGWLSREDGSAYRPSR